MSHVLLFAVYAIAGLAVGYGFPVFAPTLGSEAAPAAGVALFALAGFLHTGLALSALRCHRARGLGEAADAQTALKLRAAGVHNFSVAPTQANVMALPLMIKYKLFG